MCIQSRKEPLALAIPHIFVVDDEPAIARIVEVNLVHAGYEVRTARDGIEALTRLQSEPTWPDLLLLDVTMPYMDGFELLAHLKADPKLASIPAIMVTARNKDSDIIEGHSRGALYYLTKPIMVDELLQIVKLTLDASPPASNPEPQEPARP